jgi:hypothetical protein
MNGEGMTKNRSTRAALLACACVVGLGLVAGASPAVAKTKKATFDRCVSAAVAIPDGPAIGTTAPNPAASFAVPVNVPKFKGKRQEGVVTAFHSAGVRISHTDDGDLALFLVSPGGRVVSLASYRDQSTNSPQPSGDGYGSGPASCLGPLVQLGDAFPTSIATPGNTGDSTPIAGSFKPEQPLSTFVGGPARGFWTLIVQDIQGADVGQINALSLNFTYRYKAKPKKK